MIETVSAWVLPEGGSYRRESPRPLHKRPPDFDTLFDAHTVFYDCFRRSETNVMLLGPPLVRFPGIPDSLQIWAGPQSTKCRFVVEHKLTTAFGNRRTHNLCRLSVEVPEGADTLRVECAAGSACVPILPSGTAAFQGKKVLLTLSRNNHPVWICDWMRLHRDLHQADAVLLYDNGSTAYSLEELLAAMKQVAGFRVVAVVAWPYKYGPQGIGRGTWDSAFCQDGALEDARWRFLADAHGVLSCDIDECILSSRGSVFDTVAASAKGYVKFSGRWVHPSFSVAQHEPSSHQESTHQLLPSWRWSGLRFKDVHRCPAKWAVVPGRCPPAAHWSVHEIVGMTGHTMKRDDLGYRHFRKINTHWKKTRSGLEPSQGAMLKSDDALQKAFTRVRWNE